MEATFYTGTMLPANVKQNKHCKNLQKHAVLPQKNDSQQYVNAKTI